MAKRIAMHRIAKKSLVSIALLASLGTTGLALAQKPAGLPGNYPSKSVRVIVGASPGGGADNLSRMIFGKLGEIWGANFNSENVLGAGGMIAMDQLRKAPADGYTLSFSSSSSFINAAFVATVPWDVSKSFTLIAPVTKSTLLLAASKNAPFKNFRELIAYAKANPGKLDYGASGYGGSPHVTSERIWHEAGVKLVHVAYKGTGQAVVDTISGRVPVIMGSVAALTPHVKAGKITLMGVTSRERVESAPDFQTLHEAGLPGFNYIGWFGAIGPANMDPAIVNALNKGIMAVLDAPDVKAAMKKSGADQMKASPAEFHEVVMESLDRTGSALKAMGLDLRKKK